MRFKGRHWKGICEQSENNEHLNLAIRRSNQSLVPPLSSVFLTLFPTGAFSFPPHRKLYPTQQQHYFAGNLGKEAREFVKLIAKMSGGDLSWTILRIYQTLAVEFQTARAEQIYITNRRYATNTPPLPPSSLLHPILPIVHPPPTPPPTPPTPLSLLDPRLT
jgi:hypothetical protein